MTNVRKRAIKMYWKMAKKKCPFQTEEIVNGYLEGFIDCAEYLLLQIAELEEQIKKMKQLLEKWDKQHSDKTYTKTFYDELIKATEEFLWSDVCVK